MATVALAAGVGLAACSSEQDPAQDPAQTSAGSPASGTQQPSTPIVGPAGTATVPGDTSPITDDQLFDPCTIPAAVVAGFGLDPQLTRQPFDPPLRRWRSCVWDSPTRAGFSTFAMVTAYTYQELLDNPEKVDFRPTRVGDREATFYTNKGSDPTFRCWLGWGTSTGSVMVAVERAPLDETESDLCPIAQQWADTVFPSIPK